MILNSEQEFSLVHPVDQGQALSFVRSPGTSLSQVRFLSDIRVHDDQLRGTLLVKAPGLGEVDLPFVSQMIEIPEGAALRALALPGENAWVAVNGQASVEASVEAGVAASVMHFTFQFTAHLTLPDVPGWGGAAFEKMVNAAAQRTLRRVAEALPRDIQAALSASLN